MLSGQITIIGLRAVVAAEPYRVLVNDQVCILMKLDDAVRVAAPAGVERVELDVQRQFESLTSRKRSAAGGPATGCLVGIPLAGNVQGPAGTGIALWGILRLVVRG